MEFRPVKKWHTNKIYTGPKGVSDLPLTQAGNEDTGTGIGLTLNSVWFQPSIWERVKFLFHGEVTLRIVGNIQPPVSVVCGDIFGRSK